jgi:hypothetical protein
VFRVAEKRDTRNTRRSFMKYFEINSVFFWCGILKAEVILRPPEWCIACTQSSSFLEVSDLNRSHVSFLRIFSVC